MSPPSSLTGRHRRPRGDRLPRKRQESLLLDGRRCGHQRGGHHLRLGQHSDKNVLSRRYLRCALCRLIRLWRTGMALARVRQLT